MALAAAACGAHAPLSVSPAEYDPLAQTLRPLAAGAAVSLQIPPQGGLVLFIGAEVRGLDPGAAELHARVRTPGGLLLGEDSRTSTFVAAEAGTVEPDPRSFFAMANVALCPGAPTAVEGAPATLEVTVSAGGASATATVEIVPRCAQTDAALLATCRCTCAPGYVPGAC